MIAQTGFDIEGPGLFPGGLVDVRLTQREVILARKSAGLKLTNAHGGRYAAFLTIPTVIGVPVSFPWAWASVDATRHGRSFRFATTHLDPISGDAQQAQAAEFLAGPGSTTMPIVWVGDFNSDADATVITGVPSATATYGSIIAAGFSDAWLAKHPSDPGFTCCQATNLLNPVSTLTERDDLVMTRGPFQVGRASIVGDEVSDQLASGLWPSDHAGVVVTLELESGGYVMNRSVETRHERIPVDVGVCRLEGTFILGGTGGVHVLDLAIPLDTATDRVALVHDLADYDVTLGGLLPTAVRYTTAQGEAIRTGPRSFDYTLHFWGVDSSNRRVSLVVSSGTKVFRAGDCGIHDTVGGTLAVYLASQDADGDGFPDDGATPVACVPIELTARRDAGGDRAASLELRPAPIPVRRRCIEGW